MAFTPNCRKLLPPPPGWLLAARYLAAAILLLLAGVAPTQAALVLSTLIVDFVPGKPTRADVEVSNTGKETLYLQTKAFQIVEPGRAGQQRVPITDPRSGGLLVTPNKLILPPGERKLIRLVSFTPPGDADRIYRVTVTPVVGELETDRSALKVMVAYELLVMVRPANPQPELVAKRQGRQLSIRNAGNTNVLLFQGRQCAAENSCVELQAKRIYPNASWNWKLPLDAPVRFTQQTMELKNEILSIP